MILTKNNLNQIASQNIIKPSPEAFNFPEKVLQFGTGVLLRGLPDYFIDKANRKGVFNGRVAVVKSTGTATAEFDDQDSLYTLCVRGIENGNLISENIISSAISRVIAADKNWSSILEIAKSPDLKIVISNTTEVGIALLKESVDQNPPASFPAKLLAVLIERFKAFNGSKNAGLVIIATELIPENGKKLAEIVNELAKFNALPDDFITWLNQDNTFCNSLVDRIVPGKPDATTLASIKQELGYSDHLLAMTEPYRLWAIEGGQKVKDVLEFAKIDAGVVISEDIEIYRELKVRLLNGTHTLTSGIAFLAGIATVKNAMSNPQVNAYIETLMNTEISPAIPYQVTEPETSAFSKSVVDRFANPFIEHLWLNITFQYSMKMKIRVLPLLLNHYKIFQKVPEKLAFGYAAYLVFMKTNKTENGKYFGAYNDIHYQITDDKAAYFYEKSKSTSYVIDVLSDAAFWTADLSLLSGFIDEVNSKYNAILVNGIAAELANLNALSRNMS